MDLAKVTGEISETAKSFEKASEGFDPDKRIDVSKQVVEKQDTKAFDPDKRVEVSDTKEINQYDHIPQDGERGKWKDKPGDSMYIPNENYNRGFPSGKDAVEALKEKGQVGIEYKNGEPDFSKVAEATVKIDNMSDKRYGADGNFAMADKALADKWNKENHGGRNDWTARDVKAYRQQHDFTWHECKDLKTMHLMDGRIHSYFTHTGGVAICKMNNNKEVKFDA